MGGNFGQWRTPALQQGQPGLSCPTDSTVIPPRNVSILDQKPSQCLDMTIHPLQVNSSKCPDIRKDNKVVPYLKTLLDQRHLSKLWWWKGPVSFLVSIAAGANGSFFASVYLCASTTSLWWIKRLMTPRARWQQEPPLLACSIRSQPKPVELCLRIKGLTSLF